MQNNIIGQYILDIIGMVLTITIPIVVRYIIIYLDAKKQKAQKELGAKQFRDTVDTAISTVQNIVDTVSQTYVNELKNTNTFTKEKQQEAFNKALESAKAMISEDAKNILSTFYADYEEFLKVQIESYILSNKS